MKVFYIFTITASCFAVINALPAVRDDVEFVPLEAQEGGPIIDTGIVGSGGGSWFNPVGDLFESFAEMMARMRQQMDFLLRHLPFNRNGTVESGAFPFGDIPDIDLSKGNTTSVTKVIDGHKVVINETEYKKEGDNGGAFFKVRIIDVLPDSSEMTTDKNAESITTPTKEPESMEDSIENEIPKNKEHEDIETIEEVDSVRPNRDTESYENIERSRISNQPMFATKPEWASIEPLESFEDNSVEFAYRAPDLSRDTYVNELMANAGAPINPDAEVFNDSEFIVPYEMSHMRQPFEKITKPR